MRPSDPDAPVRTPRDAPAATWFLRRVSTTAANKYIRHGINYTRAIFTLDSATVAQFVSAALFDGQISNNCTSVLARLAQAVERQVDHYRCSDMRTVEKVVSKHGLTLTRPGSTESLAHVRAVVCEIAHHDQYAVCDGRVSAGRRWGREALLLCC